jgi:DNA-binding MarR family transcriptional regulator
MSRLRPNADLGGEVPDESIVGLVKDLTTRLSAIAVEFGDRADRYAGNGAIIATAERQPPCAVARRLLSERQARQDFFPAELFHEPAWDMLLALYVAGEERQVMNVKTLVATTSAPVTTSQRWIDHLHKLRLIDRIIDPIDRRRVEISLSDSGERAVIAYLDRVGG